MIPLASLGLLQPVLAAVAMAFSSVSAPAIRTVNDVRAEPFGAPLVDASTRTVRRWVDRYADEAAEEYRRRRLWRVSPHTTSDGSGRRSSPATKR